MRRFDAWVGEYRAAVRHENGGVVPDANGDSACVVTHDLPTDGVEQCRSLRLAQRATAGRFEEDAVRTHLAEPEHVLDRHRAADRYTADRPAAGIQRALVQAGSDL